MYKIGDKVFLFATKDIETVLISDEENNRVFTFNKNRYPGYEISEMYIKNLCLFTPEMEKVLKGEIKE